MLDIRFEWKHGVQGGNIGLEMGEVEPQSDRMALHVSSYASAGDG
jgi:hypothetical protein